MNRNKKKYITVLIMLFPAILFGYWIKCQIGKDYSELFSLSSYFPFKYLQRDYVVDNPEAGTLIDDSFESNKFVRNWPILWMEEEGKVTQGYDSKGMDNSRCLLIKSFSKGSWSCAHYQLIKVHEGDTFNYSGFVKMEGKSISVFAGVDSFDKDKNVIRWNHFKDKVDQTNQWVKFRNRFTIHNDIRFISFKLSGAGLGEYRFDNIIFNKEGGNVKKEKLKDA